MKIMLPLLLVSTLGVSADPIDPRYSPFLQTGCIDGPPIAALDSDEGIRIDQLPQLADMPMSGNTLRFIISPDSYRGDGLLMVQIGYGLRRGVADDGQPFFLATVGTWARSCTVRMPLSDCPQAAEVSEQLKQLQIPIGYGFGPLDRITLHASTYAIQFAGVADGVNRLSYHTPGNPLEAPLNKAKASLEACWKPAFDAVKNH